MQRLTPRYRQMAMSLALLVSCIFFMVMLGKCSHRRAMPFAYTEGFSAGDTIDVAIEMNPMCYAVRGDSIFGRDYQIIRKMSERHGRPIKFHPFVPLKYALAGLDEGRFDIVVASMPVTSELRDKYLFTNPVYTDREVLVQRLDSTGAQPRITSQMQLGGDTVWIADSSPFATRLENLSAEIGDTIYVLSRPEYSSEHLVLLTLSDDIPRAVVNESVARSMKKDYPLLDISTAISFTQFQAWALRPDDVALCDTINAWLAAEN